MDRRTFLRRSTQGMAGLSFAGEALAQISLRSENLALQQMASERPLTSIAFGSCNDSTRDQRYWRIIQREQPDLWLWLGDNVYADGFDMKGRRALYRNLKSNPYYAGFLAEIPVLGTWDDHDYASDNKGSRFPDKWQSKDCFREFFDLNEAMLPSSRAGVYQSYAFGPQGQRTQIILLDLRFHMDRWRLDPQLLGDEQWMWLQGELSRSTADLLIIGSSLNVSSPIVGFGAEGWQEYGAERKRLYNLIDATQKPTIILSGDRHFAELSLTRMASGLPVYEVMSSGLTHSFGAKLPHPGRLGEIEGRKNYGHLGIEWTSIGPAVTMQIRSTEALAVYREEKACFEFEG